MGRQAMNQVKYGKIELTSADEGSSMEDLMGYLKDLLEKFGYPEKETELSLDDLKTSLETGEEEEEEEDEITVEEEEEEEPKKTLAPWEVKRGRKDEE